MVEGISGGYRVARSQNEFKMPDVTSLVDRVRADPRFERDRSNFEFRLVSRDGAKFLELKEQTAFGRFKEAVGWGQERRSAERAAALASLNSDMKFPTDIGDLSLSHGQLRDISRNFASSLFADTQTVHRQTTVASPLFSEQSDMLRGLGGYTDQEGKLLPRTEVGDTGVTLNDEFIRDLNRGTYMIDGETIPFATIPDRADIDKTKALHYGSVLIERFGRDYAEGISNCVMQGIFSPLVRLVSGMEGDAGMLHGPDGQPVQLHNLPNIHPAYDMKRLDDGSVRVRATAGFEVTSNPVLSGSQVLSDDTRGSVSFSFDVVRNGDGFAMRNFTDLVYDYHIAYRPGM